MYKHIYHSMQTYIITQILTHPTPVPKHSTVGQSMSQIMILIPRKVLVFVVLKG